MRARRSEEPLRRFGNEQLVATNTASADEQQAQRPATQNTNA
jgi:hypothetical protein